MPNSETPPAMLPGTVVLPISELDRLATTAALSAAQQVRKDSPTLDQIEDMAEKAAAKAIRNFLLEVGIDPNDLPGLRKDFAEMRSFREMKASIKDNGLRAFITMLVTGLGVWFWAKVKGAP